jgi:vibriolysin
VPAIGWEKAAQIFYRANALYLTSNSNFAAARTKTAQAAGDLYGPAEVYAINAAWYAVGVGTEPTPPEPDDGDDVSEEIHQTGLSGAKGSEAHWNVTVPAGAKNVVFAISGGTGDADIYVKRGQKATRQTWDYRPYKWGNAETVTVATDPAGAWHIMLHGYTAYSAVSLHVTWE